MKSDVMDISEMALAIIAHVEETYSALDDAQKRCILEVATQTYEAKIYRDVSLAGIHKMLTDHS
jgi:hypothetical protein